MVIFILSQSVWEFAKWRAIPAMHAGVVDVPTCQKCPNFSCLRVNEPEVCQFFNFAAKRRTNFSTSFQKNFSIFEFFNET